MKLVPVVIYPVGHVVWINPSNVNTLVPVEIKDNPAGEMRACDITVIGFPPTTIFGTFEEVRPMLEGNQNAEKAYTEKYVRPAQSKTLKGVVDLPPPGQRVQRATPSQIQGIIR